MPPQQGSGVQFDTQDDFGRPPQRSGGFDLTGKLVQWGLVKSAQEAQYVLIGITVVALVIAGYFFIHTVSGGNTLPPPPPVSA